MTDTPRGAEAVMDSGNPASANTTDKVQSGGLTHNPDAKVPSDLYPDPPGVGPETKGAPDD